MSEHSIQVDFNVPARMRDGVQLRANVYRPVDGERWPVLLTRTPYGKDLPGLMLEPVQAARHGYTVVVQDARGRFASEGEWWPTRSEWDDGADSLAWAAEQPWSDGQVGMFGLSYHGFTQWSAAAAGHPALKAIMPVFTWRDPLNGHSFRGGALELGVLAYWNRRMSMLTLFRQLADNQPELVAALRQWTLDMNTLAPIPLPPRRERNAEGIVPAGYASLPLADMQPLPRELTPEFYRLIEGGPRRATAETADVGARTAEVMVPSFNVAGWYDLFLQDSIDNYLAMRRRGAPAKLLIGPWAHLQRGSGVGQMNFGVAADMAFMDLRTPMDALQLRWFDHWLKGQDTGLLAEPPVRIFTMGANVWRDEREWPLQRAEPTPWYLGTNGGLSPSPPGDDGADRFDYDPANPVPVLGGSTLLTVEFPAGPYDQRPIEARPDVLSYTSDPLERELEVTGPIQVRLWAASSAPDTDFVARLVDVHPDGFAQNLADGIIRASYAHAGNIEPGRAYEYAIDLWSTSNLFKAGHRIRLDVTSSSFPRWDRNLNTGHPWGFDAEMAVAHQTILHGGAHASHVLLPTLR